MTITREGQFFIDETKNRPNWIGIETAQISKCVTEAKSKPYYGVFGSPDFGFHEDKLDFLMELKHLQQVWFWDVKLTDIDGLYALNKLEFFGIHPKRPGIDFAKLISLKSAVLHSHHKDKNLESLVELKKLNFWYHNPKQKTFSDLNFPPNLESLEINWANPAGMEGFPVLPKLKTIQFHYCRNLSSLKGLENYAPQIEGLIVNKCNKFSKFENLGNFKKLKSVFINGKDLKG